MAILKDLIVNGSARVLGTLHATKFKGTLEGNADTATTASKLGTNAGSDTQPVYFSNGVPTNTTYTLGKSVPSDAKFTDTTYGVATTSANGLMSSTDKKKLDGIAEGANKTIVDSALSSTSTNPVQNKVVNTAISNLNTLVGNTAVATQISTAIASKADLDTNGKVPSSQLPSYVDDVLEYNGKSNFPSAGESGKIYVDTATNLTYRWSGSAYVEISQSLALGETSSTAYRGDRGKTAYDHSQSTHARTDATKTAKSSTNGNILINGTETTVYTHPSGTNPHGTTKSDVGLGNVGNFKAVSTVASQGLTDTEKSNARANIGAGTSSFSGNYNDLSNKPTIPTVGNGTITIKQAGSSKGTFTLNQSGNTTIELTDNDTTYSEATTSAAGLMSKDDKAKLNGIATGANKTVVDTALSSTSTNPVQNKVVNTAITNLNTLVGDTAVSAQINAATSDKANKPTITTTTLLAANWNSNTKIYSFEADYPSTKYDIEIEINGDSCTDEQLEAWIAAKPLASSTNKINARGDLPSIDIPVIITTTYNPKSLPLLSFIGNEDFTLKTYPNNLYWDGTLEYSTDMSTWNTWNGTEISSSDSRLYLRGIGNGSIADGESHFVFTGTDTLKVTCEGNIENLLDYATVSAGEHPIMSGYGLAALFMECTNLVTPPELPATTLTNFCYNSMFRGCTSLTTAPELPATTLTTNCYGSMFSGCTSLTTPPELPAATLATYCYDNMFNGCTSLTTAPELPATTLAKNCYSSMFSSCTSLTTAPELPATTLADSCYADMFRDCTSLITIPILSVTTLTNYCYSQMFYNCRNIKLSTTQTGEYQMAYRIPISGTGTTASSALTGMFARTGGTFTDTPEINTTYYTSNTVV